MTRAQIQVRVLRLLGNFAPEADLTRLPAQVNFREYLDLDSMDFCRNQPMIFCPWNS